MVDVELSENHWLEPLEGFIKAAHESRLAACSQNLESLNAFSKRIALLLAGQPLSFFYQNP